MKDGNKFITITDPKTGYISEYSMSIRLKRNLDEVITPALQKKDKDYVLIIDGGEGSGKSTFAFQVGKCVDPSLNLSRIVFTADEFREALFKAKKGQCVIFDEAFTGFSSRASLSSVNRTLVNLMMQVRQKNLFIIIVLPTFFLLDKYLALFRAKALIHVFESKGVRGYFRVYNSRLKKLLYLLGQKTFSYFTKKVRTYFKGRFYGKFALGDAKVEKLYRKKKIKSLQDSEKNPMTAGQVKYREQRDLLLWLFKNYTAFTYKQIDSIIGEYGLEMSYAQISRICARFGGFHKLKAIEPLENGKESLNKEENKEDKVEIGSDDKEKSNPS